jgi:hypothetical protein
MYASNDPFVCEVSHLQLQWHFLKPLVLDEMCFALWKPPNNQTYVYVDSRQSDMPIADNTMIEHKNVPKIASKLVGPSVHAFH